MMSNGDFIVSQLGAFGINDADLMLIRDEIELDAELKDVSLAEKAMIPLLAKAVMAPHQTSVSEHGISITWNMDRLGWWYRYLCKKYGVTPDPLVEEALGLSVITDRTSKW